MRSSSTRSRDRHRPLGAQQPVERDRALEPVGRIDDEDLVEAVGQIGRLAHVVDGLADGPERRHRDELGLHPPAGGVFRIVQAALERGALGRRQLLEDVGLLVLRQVLQDVDGVVGIELADALGDGLGRQLLEDLLAHRVVDLGERGEVERAAHQLDQARAQLRIERLEEIADVGLVQFADQLGQRSGVAGVDRGDHPLDEVPPQRAVVIAKRRRFRLGRGAVLFIEHAEPRGRVVAGKTPVLRRAMRRGKRMM